MNRLSKETWWTEGIEPATSSMRGLVLLADARFVGDPELY
jgi:hypothetical protein